MGFKALTNFFSGVASKLMGLSTPANSIASSLVDGNEIVSGTNNGLSTFLDVILSTLGDIWTLFYESVVRLFYMLGHWMLTIIDFIFVFVRQLVGMNTNFDSLEEITQGDIIFQFIFNDTVLTIIKNIIIFSLVLLILFCIFAIVKSEYEFVTNQSSNSKKQVLVSALRSLFLMVFVPLVFIGSIIMSNAILRSLYMITSGGNSSFSMGTQIFIASTYDANAYRNYANLNYKIPITFNFKPINASDNISGYYTDGTVAEAEQALKAFKQQDVWNRGFRTYLQFSTNEFLSMSDVDELDRKYASNNEISPYHDVYDMGLYSRSEQYYIMSDVIEYAMKNNVEIYFKSLQEVYDSYYSVDEQVRLKSDSIMPIGFDKKTSEKNAIINNNGSKIDRISGVDGNGGSYEVPNYYVNVFYAGDSESTTYKHAQDSSDEADGSTYVIALKRTVIVDNGEGKDKTQVEYYYPLMNGRDNFATDYYNGTRNVVIAKGLFEDGKYPTAIREINGKIEFYRDDINVPMLMDLFPKISYELPAGSTEELGLKILKGSLSMLTGVDISQFIPYVYFSFDIFNLFTKTCNVIADLDNGMMKIDYNFTSRDFDKINVYKWSNFNIIIFVLASGMILSIMMKTLFGLVFRTLDVVALALTYPAVLSTMPLDNGERFKEWCKTITSKILPIYAVVVAINLVLMIVPITWEIQLFSVADIEYGIAMGELGSTLTAKFLNFITHILFTMVAFSSINPFINSVGNLITTLTKKDKNEKDIEYNPLMDDGEMVINDLKALPQTIGNVVTGKFIVDGVKKIGEGAAAWIPGGALIGGEVKHSFEPVNKMRARMERANKISGANQSIEDLVKNAKSLKEQGGSHPGSALSSGNGGASAKEAATMAAGAGGGSGNIPSGGGSPSAPSGDASQNEEAFKDSADKLMEKDDAKELLHMLDEETNDQNHKEAQEINDVEVPSEQIMENSDLADETGEELADEHGQDIIESGLDALGNAIPVTGVATGALSLAAKTVAKTTKFVYKTTKTAVKLAGKLALAVGKLTLGLTKTALKMAGRVVKTTAKAVYNYGTGRQGGLKTLNQIIFNAGVGTAVIGASEITKSGLKFGKDVVKASAVTTGNVLKNFGTSFFGKTQQRNKGYDYASVVDDSNPDAVITDKSASSHDRTSKTNGDAQESDLKQGNHEEKLSDDDDLKESDTKVDNSEDGSDDESSESETIAQTENGDKSHDSTEIPSEDTGSGSGDKESKSGGLSGDSGSEKQTKKVTVHVSGSPSDYEAEVTNKKGKNSIIARRKTSHKNSARKTGKSLISDKTTETKAESSTNKKGKDSIIALRKTSHKNSTRKKKE